MKPSKKISLNDAIGEADTALHNSNMTNAAHAIVAINKYRERLDRAEAELRSAAEDAGVPHEDFRQKYDSVFKLVDRI